MESVDLSAIALFEGLDAAALREIAAAMQTRHVAAHQLICREGEPGSSLFVIQSGLAQVMVQRAGGGDVIVARLRRGDIVGEMSLVTGEPRSATVVASVPTVVLELLQAAFASVLGRYPAILANLSRILSGRVAQGNLRQADGHRRGEAVALVLGHAIAPYAREVIAATRAAGPASLVALAISESLPPAAFERQERGVESILGLLDGLLSSHGRVLVLAEAGQADLPLLLDHMDRAVVVAGEDEARALAARLVQPPENLELVLAGVGLSRGAAPPGMRQVGQVALADPAREIAWLGRHLSRTKLGLAMGAGGAKGYAHIGALQVLQEGGYTIDYVSGSSIGAIVGAWHALGMDAAAVEATMRRVHTPENVAAMFKLSFGGVSSGLELWTRLLRESTDDRTFADLRIPLSVMCVDLNTTQPAPIREGPLWQALLAATALAGLFPPYQRGAQRLVDGLALVPVPTQALTEAGADITLSVNIISRETLPAWPGQPPPEPPAARGGARMLDTLLEVMDVAQLDASVRHAARADVVVTPRFGPASWRDFHLGDLFLAAGREAAAARLPALGALARPQSKHREQREEHYDSAVHL